MVQFRDDDDKDKPPTEESSAVKEAAEKPDAKVTSEEADNLARVVALAVVAIGAALIEVELVAGVALGAAAMLAPQVISIFRSGKKKTAKSPAQAGASEAEAEAA